MKRRKYKEKVSRGNSEHDVPATPTPGPPFPFIPARMRDSWTMETEIRCYHRPATSTENTSPPRAQDMRNLKSETTILLRIRPFAAPQ